MIIVSQDKTKIVNFENIDAIEIGNPLEYVDGMFKVFASTTSDNEYTLGRYSTEERAKEVLREIYCRYEHLQSLLSSKCITVQDFMGKDFIYEMPEEEDYEK